MSKTKARELRINPTDVDLRDIEVVKEVIVEALGVEDDTPTLILPHKWGRKLIGRTPK